MTLKLEVFSTGPLGNNVCILYDDELKKALVFDPSYEPQPVLDFINRLGLTVERILLTHGHFDHFAGVEVLLSNLPNKPGLACHRDDLELLRDGGGSKKFHMPIFLPREPDEFLSDRQVLSLAGRPIEVRSTPGHTPGSVIFVVPDITCAICGDLIFYHSVGRTDLEGGSQQALLASINDQVFSLPLATRLIPSHGEETTVQEEMDNNPFLNFIDY